jgi:hypothetical protein
MTGTYKDESGSSIQYTYTHYYTKSQRQHDAMNPDSKLLLKEIHKEFAEQKRLIDKRFTDHGAKPENHLLAATLPIYRIKKMEPSSS